MHLLYLILTGCDPLVGSDLTAHCGGLHLEYSDDGTLLPVLFGHAAVASPVCGVTTPAASTSDWELFLKQVDVHEDATSGNVTLATDIDDGSVRWIADKKRKEEALRSREEDLLNSKREKDLQAREARLRQKEVESLEADGSIIDDGCWLRPPEDKRNITLAELEGVIKGLLLAAKCYQHARRATHDRFEDGCRVAEANHGQRTSREDQGPARRVGATPPAAHR